MPYVTANFDKRKQFNSAPFHTRFYSFSEDEKICIIPHDDGDLQVEELGQEATTNFSTTLFVAGGLDRYCHLIFKIGFHTCVSRTYNSTRCLTMYEHHCSQAIPSLRLLTFAVGCEACAAICCDCDLRKPRTQDIKNIFCFPEKRSRLRKIIITTNFGKSLF